MVTINTFEAAIRLGSYILLLPGFIAALIALYEYHELPENDQP